MLLRADALRFVLEQGLPAVIEVSGRSMEPTLALGTKVDVAALAAGAPLEVGDVVLVATKADVLLLHRVLGLYEESGAAFVVHQGDAPASMFGLASRRNVLARMTGIAGESDAPPAVERLDGASRARFRRRRFACEGFLAARRLVSGLGLADSVLVRKCARLYRRLSRVLVG
jgi:hypothetical protein